MVPPDSIIEGSVCSSGWLGHTVCVLVWDPCGSDPGIVWSSITYGLAGGADRVEDPFCLQWRAHSGVGMGVTTAFVFEFAGSQGRVVSVTGRAFPGGSGGRAPNCCACNFAICQWERKRLLGCSSRCTDES